MGKNGWYLVAAFALLALVAVGLVATAAVPSATLGRETTATVTADDAAVLTLVDGHPGGGFVEQAGGSTLAIDLTRGGANGANPNATVELGAADEPITDHAFRLEHRGTAPGDLTVGYGLAPGSGAGDPDGPESLVVTFFHDAGDDGGVDAQVAVSENAGSTNATLPGVAPGDVVYATVEIDTTGLSSASDLSGALEVTARGGG